MSSYTTHLFDQRRLSRKIKYLTYKVKRRTPWRELYLKQNTTEWRQGQITPMEIPTYGDLERGENLLQGQFRVGIDKNVEFFQFLSRPKADQSMRQCGASQEEIVYLHSFAWLEDLMALGNAAPPMKDTSNLLDSEDHLRKCRSFAQNTLNAWVRQYNKYSPTSWQIPPLARRLNNWLYYFAHFLGHWSENREIPVLRSISMQLHHLRLCVMDETVGFERIYGLICWVNASLCLNSENDYLEEGKLLLALELREQLHNPEGTVLASPSTLAEIYTLLNALSKGFSQLGIGIPLEFKAALKRLEKLLVYYQIVPQRLGYFHHISAKQNRPANHLPKVRGAKHPPEDAAELPIKRISHQGFTLMLDTASLRADHPEYMHASALSLELADKQQMIFINPCPPLAEQMDNENIARLPQMHSTVLLENLPWAESKRKALYPPYSIHTRIAEQNNRVWLEGSHNALQKMSKKYGGTILRKFYLPDSHGEERYIRAVDTVELGELFKETQTISLIAQFHLDPSVQAVRNEGGGIILHTQRKSMGWVFTAPKPARIHLIETQLHDDGQGEAKMLQTLHVIREIKNPEAGRKYPLNWQLAATDRK